MEELTPFHYTSPSKIPHFLVKHHIFWYNLGSPKPLIGNQVKHILILSILLLLSSPLFGQETGVLYRWDTGDKVYVWKTFGDEGTNPKYKGEIKNGKPEGFGIILHPDGVKYVGMWKNGKSHGYGEIRNGENVMKGEFKEGLQWNTKWYFKGKQTGEFVNGKHIQY